MKIMHLSDLHLGRSLGDFDLYDDQKYILDRILDLIDTQDIDAVLIAGDVYDKSVPSEAATKLLDDFLFRLSAKEKEVFIISGNHDSDDRLNYGSRLFEHNRIHISSVYDGKLPGYSIEKDGVSADIYLMPFVKASQVKHFYPDEEIETYEDAFRVILSRTGLDESKHNILVAHQFVAGKGADPEFGGSESIGTRSVANGSVGLVERIGYSLFDRFDYVALGHIHSPQQVGRPEVRYSGSPLKYSLTEADNKKSVPVITIGERNVSIELIPLVPRRDVRHIKGKLKELLDRANVTRSDDFIYATLTDDEFITDAIGIFRQTYPNTVKIDYDNKYTKDIETTDITAVLENRSFEDLIGEFYRMMYGDTISDEEMAIMKEVAGEAGVSV